MSEQPWDDQWDDGDMSEPSDMSDGTAGGEVTPGTDLAVATGTELDIETPLTTDQAREITDAIRSTSEVLYVLLARAHAGKAWQALGYSSFQAYVREEFDMSRSRAYQVLDQARVVAAIEDAAPDGVDLPAISEAAARDLRGIIGEVGQEIQERTADLEPNEAGKVVEEIVEKYRDEVRDRREEDALEREEAEQDAAERRGFSDTSNTGVYTPPPPPSFDDDEDDDDFDPALLRRNVQAAYDLYSSLSALKSMPDIYSVIDTIPPERRTQINDSIANSVDWLQEFMQAWLAQPWQEGNADPSSDDDGYDDYDGDEEEM